MQPLPPVRMSAFAYLVHKQFIKHLALHSSNPKLWSTNEFHVSGSRARTIFKNPFVLLPIQWLFSYTPTGHIHHGPITRRSRLETLQAATHWGSEGVADPIGPTRIEWAALRLWCVLEQAPLGLAQPNITLSFSGLIHNQPGYDWPVRHIVAVVYLPVVVNKVEVETDSRVGNHFWNTTKGKAGPWTRPPVANRAAWNTSCGSPRMSIVME